MKWNDRNYKNIPADLLVDSFQSSKVVVSMLIVNLADIGLVYYLFINQFPKAKMPLQKQSQHFKTYENAAIF